MLLKIITYPNPILEKVSEKVKFPLDEETKSLIKNMWETVNGKGIGLAAPQVGVNKQICIIHLPGELQDKPAKQKLPRKDLNMVVINPVVTFTSQLENLMVEGCLSFPNQFYEIWRPANITVEFYDENGKKNIIKAKEWLSRVIQHEVGHLNGQVFIKLGGKKVDEKEIANRKIID